MKFSELFVKTFHEAPKSEEARGAKFLVQAGYIHKELAGIYDYLPFGLRVLEKIKTIIREELNKIGSHEILLSTLQNPELWGKTNRWDIEKMDIWFKTELAAGGELGLAPTHEEPLTELMKSYIKSYKDLPVAAYQIQTKFRNELRAKSGIMRGREFLMKDMYSFSSSEAEHEEFYHKSEEAYAKIYERLGIGDCTYRTFASGGVFAKYSHEFQTVVEVGEDTIWHNADWSVVLNEEVMQDEILAEFDVKREELESTRAAEVGNIFTLKDKFSRPLGLEFTDRDGKKQPVFMGCYGIGVSRVMGVIAEKFADEKGLVWPEAIAPFKYYLVGIGENGMERAAELYRGHSEEVLFDDRDLRPGEKFADAELIGIPYRVVVSDKTLENGEAEITERKSGETRLVKLSDLTF